MRRYAFNTEINQPQTIIVNGKTMLITEYRKQMRAKQQPKKKTAKKQETYIRILPAQIKTMLKCAKVMKSLSAYYDNGYNQWGTICNDILNIKQIRPNFTLYRLKVKEVDKTINNINKIAKHNEKAVFQYVRQLSWQLDDTLKYMQLLSKGVEDSGVMYAFADHEAINGEGKRLGLRTLMIRTYFALNDLENVIKQLQKIADNRGEC